MTLAIEFPPATEVIEAPEGDQTFRARTNWAQAALWMHGLLSQTLSDDVIDELIWAAEAGLNQTAVVVSPVLVG